MIAEYDVARTGSFSQKRPLAFTQEPSSRWSETTVATSSARQSIGAPPAASPERGMESSPATVSAREMMS